MVRYLGSPLEPNVVRFVEVHGDGCSFFVRARRISDKILVEEISNSMGHLSTVMDVVRETGHSVESIRDAITEAFGITSRR